MGMLFNARGAALQKHLCSEKVAIVVGAEKS